MAKKSIANRWFVNSFSVVAILLLILDIGLFFVIKSYFYSAVSQYLGSEANIISGVLMRFYDSSATTYSSEMRRMVENFDKKGSMELMVLDRFGNVEISSSGFTPATEYDMPDYKLALENGGSGEYIGYLDSGEKYLAVSVLIDENGSNYNAIRVVSSLENIDSQIYFVILVIGIVSILVLLLVLLLGLYFIKSIVSPLRQVSLSAKQLAGGDFSTRIEIHKDDEIGELCQTFNNMADELENSENIKNDFISSVSHELRTPLTAIKGWSETITEVQDEEMLRKGMRVITAETERLSAMVEELLDFSRIQNGRLILQKTNLDIVAELSDAILVYAEKAKRDGIKIAYVEPETVAIVNGDKNRIRQVFINIIDNAIKYGGKGAVITIDCEFSENTVTISVTDNGCGISAADLPKVKTKFFKANNTVRGSGIGLAVADEIVLMHGGSLDIKSTVGKGTTVVIILPIVNK